jgi:hypothetical protein
LTLEFHDGRVTLVARDVSVRQILDEWAKVGHTLIIHGDRVNATPVTLQIEGLPEREALEVVLRSAAGYMAAPRPADNPGPSMYDRILVLAVSNPPAASSRPTTPAAFPAPRRAVPQFQPPGPLLLPEDDDPSFDEPDLDESLGGPFATPGAPPGVAPGAPPNAQPFPRVPGSPPPTTNVPGGTSVPGIVAAPPPAADR